MGKLALGIGIGPTYTEGSLGPDLGPTPTDIVWGGSHSVAEDAALGTQIGSMLTSDAPGAIFRLTSNSNGLFDILNDYVIVSGVLDYETATSHNITIAAGMYSEPGTVTVTDVAEGAATYPPPTGTVVVEPSEFVNPPVATTVNEGVKLHGKKGIAAAKFIYDIGVPEADTIYTMRYDPDFSLLENGGVSAMVSFGMKQGNNFRFSGLKGDGGAGLKAYEIYGTNWNQLTGFTTSDGGTALNGTQAGPNWLQFQTSGDGATYTLRTSADGVTWNDEFTGIVPAPEDNVVADYTTFGIGVFFEADDTGNFSILIDLWISAPATVDAYWNNVVLLAGFNGANAATAFSDESGSYKGAATFMGNAQLSTSVLKFGTAALLLDGTDDYVKWATHPDWAPYTQPFTYEGWFYFTVSPVTNVTLMGFMGVDRWQIWFSSGKLMFRDGNAHSSTGYTWAPTINTWYHIAYDRDAAGVLRGYVNGVMQDKSTGYTWDIGNAADELGIGTRLTTPGSYEMTGSIDDVRLTSRIARYASDGGFTALNAKFPRNGTAVPVVFMGKLQSGSGTYTNAPVGPASSDRIVVVCLTRTSTGATGTTSVTAGGITLTLFAATPPNFTSPRNNAVEIWYGLVPTGTTATIVATCNASDIITLQHYVVRGCNPVPIDSVASISETDTSIEITDLATYANGAVVGIASIPQANTFTGVPTWTGTDLIQEDFNGVDALSNIRIKSFHFVPSVTSTTNDIGQVVSGSVNHIGAAISFAPTSLGDPYWSYVKLLLGFNGADAATTATDESYYAKGAATFVGNAQLDTAQTKWGTASILFDGTGDKITYADSFDWTLSTANSNQFTVECWIRPHAASNMAMVGQGVYASNRASWAFWFSAARQLTFYISQLGNTVETIGGTGTIMTLDTWYHVACDKDAAGKIRLYVNGVMTGSATPTNSALFNSTDVLEIGSWAAVGDFNGHIDDLRITKGIARYKSDSGFIVPTAAFPRGSLTPGAGPQVTYLGTFSDTTTITPHTFSVDVGAAGTKLIVICPHSVRAAGSVRTITSVSIDGTNGTIAGQAGHTDGVNEGTQTGIVYREISTAGSISIVCTWSATHSFSACDVYKITGHASATPTDFESATGDNPSVTALAVSANGCVIVATGGVEPSQTAETTLSNVTLNNDQWCDGTLADMRIATGHATTVSATSAFTSQMTSAAGYEVIVAASWG